MIIHEQDHSMIMRYPAARWQDALPAGSGIVGALLYGQICNDTIVLNHDELYCPKEKAKLVDVSDRLPEVRRLINSGQYKEAAELMPNAYAEQTGTESGSTSSQRDPYQPVCAISLSTTTDGLFRSYRRGVDFSTGRVWVQWTDDTAVFTRELFVSRVSDTVFVRVRSSEQGSVCCRAALCEHKNEQAELKGWAGSRNNDVLVSQRTISGNRFMTYSAKYPNGFSFGAVSSVTVVGGKISSTENDLVVEDADEVIIQVRIFVGENPDVAISRFITESKDNPVNFDAAFAEHSALHGQLFNRMTLELDKKKRQANEEMLMTAYDGDVPTSLIQTMFEFGRYLLICSSRPGGWPANLQGIWNGDYSPAWNSDFHNDENIQMNYWQALPGSLHETVLPFFDYFEKWIDDYRGNAGNIFGCRGILVPIAQTTHGRETPCIWSNWTAAAGWIGQHFYDYFLFTGDLKFLRERAVPWLKEVALFYEDFLIAGSDGKLLFSPSLSPENKPAGSENMLTMNATMDIAVCREVLGHLCDACELLKIESDGRKRWRTMLSRLPEYAINEDGAIMEWLHPSFKDNYHHRHQSHLYPLFPGLEITRETHPDLYDACQAAVEKRLIIGLVSQTGWSMAHMANIYARLGMGNRALECLEILSRSSVGPNLFTYHNDWRDMGLSLIWGSSPPFQIDANLGITAAILEILVFSKPGLIKLLPALPDKWLTGSVKGIACRGGITVDMEWDMEKGLFRAVLLSKSDQCLLIHLLGGKQDVTFDPGAAAAICTERETGYWNITMQKGVPFNIQ